MRDARPLHATQHPAHHELQVTTLRMRNLHRMVDGVTGVVDDLQASPTAPGGFGQGAVKVGGAELCGAAGGREQSSRRDPLQNVSMPIGAASPPPLSAES